MIIHDIEASLIKNSRGKDAVQVCVNGYCASSPSGSSKGAYEAREINPIASVKKIKEIVPRLLQTSLNQHSVDSIIIDISGDRKSAIGGNGSTALSMAACRAAGSARLYDYIAKLSSSKLLKMPIPIANLIEGGVHTEGSLCFQEFLAIPIERTFRESYNSVKDVNNALLNILKKRYSEIKYGMEGGLSLNISANAEALDLLTKAIDKTGLNVKIGIDAAATQLYMKDKYLVDKALMNSDEMADMYKNMVKTFPIIYIEDPFHENDFKSFARLNKAIGKAVMICGDDLTTTNIKRVEIAASNSSCNSVIIKINQIGTVTEAIEACLEAKKNKWIRIVSHRSGETMDDFIADFAVGVGAEFVKIGAPHQKERIAKYKRLLEIEEDIG